MRKTLKLKNGYVIQTFRDDNMDAVLIVKNKQWEVKQNEM